MGLIKAAAKAIGSTLEDQWKEAIRCEDMANDILMMKKTTPTGVISNKSTLIVAPRQCAIIYDNGKVNHGQQIWNTSTNSISRLVTPNPKPNDRKYYAIKSRSKMLWKIHI